MRCGLGAPGGLTVWAEGEAGGLPWVSSSPCCAWAGEGPGLCILATLFLNPSMSPEQLCAFWEPLFSFVTQRKQCLPLRVAGSFPDICIVLGKEVVFNPRPPPPPGSSFSCPQQCPCTREVWLPCSGGVTGLRHAPSPGELPASDCGRGLIPKAEVLEGAFSHCGFSRGFPGVP